MSKTNKFHVKKIKESRITVEEERKNRSPLALFFIKNGRLIFLISLLFSITVFIIAVYFIILNIDKSSIVKYESNGVIVSFDGKDNSIINGIPITEEYASKLFDGIINHESNSVGVVIKLKEIKLGDKMITYYSDNTALINYNDGSYLKVSSVNNKYGINEDGIINKSAVTKEVRGRREQNDKLGISMLFLSDGSIEVTKDNTTFYVRNQDITNKEQFFYTNLSGVSLAINKDNNKVYYSDGTIKENNYIMIDNNKYGIKDEKKIHNNIKIIYYKNGYAEVIKEKLSIMVKNSDHIIFDENILEINNTSITKIDINDVMDVKQITLNNTNTVPVNYIVVLEETNDYKKHNISKILNNNLIRFSINVNGAKIENNFLNNNLKGNESYDGLLINNNAYILYEGSIDKFASVSLKLGLWIDYEKITNNYMDSAFIGTVKVYVESLN